MRPLRPFLTYLGVIVTMAGFALIAYTWGRVAALLDVALQIPYLVSGGLTGVGLILVGVTMVNVQAKREDAARRDRHLGQLAELLHEVGDQISGAHDEEDPEARSWRDARRAAP